MRTPPGRGSATDPVYLAISWEEVQEGGGVRTVEAHLCRKHRGHVSLKYPSARGCGRLGNSCDLCEGRQPRTISAA
jgi:hypothetical protein